MTAYLPQIDKILTACRTTLKTLITMGVRPNDVKSFTRTFSVTQVAEMVGRSRQSIYRAESDPACPASITAMADAPKGTRRYTLQQVNDLREFFGTSPRRQPGERCKVIGVQSFKGGVAKSVTTVHFAQHLALKGYRVLIIDTDPQASATSSFGFVPDQDFTAANTIGPCIDGERETLEYALIETYFPGITLVPSCLSLYEYEFGMFNAVAHAESMEEKNDFYHSLRTAIDTVSDSFDVVLIDSPPALGMTSINIIIAADALIVPTPPSLYDFASTTQFFEMLGRVLNGIAQDKRFDFIKVMPSKVDRSKGRQLDFLKIMQYQFIVADDSSNVRREEKFITDNIFATTSAIPNTASYYKTVYDFSAEDRKESGIKIDKSVYAMLDDLFGELEGDLWQSWGRDPEKRVTNIAEVA